MESVDLSDPGARHGLPRLRLGTDMDGVVYAFEAAFRQWVSFRLNKAIEHFPPARQWHFGVDWGLTNEQFDQLLEEGIRHGRLFACGDPIPGAVEALQRLAVDHDIVVITHRNRYGLGAIAEKATRHWLDTWGIPFTELHLTGAKGEIPVDLHLDDSPEVIETLRAQGLRAVVFDQPWNRHVTGARVRGWDEWVDLVDREAMGVAA